MDPVEVETADQSVLQGVICGPVVLKMERFRPVLAEVLFIDRHPEDGPYEALILTLTLKN
ncbi:MAG: hypothetical protein ACRERU_17170 [Methylococcales bacterium]